jgi:hypothetical protein
VPSPDADRRPSRRHSRVLAARFPDAGRARVAIEGLQSAGIDGDDITLLSPFPEKSHRSTHAADTRITRYLVRRIVVGFLAGIAAGVLLGAAIGVVLVAVTAPREPVGEVVALAAVGIVIGAPLGAYIGFERAGTLSDAWSVTFDDLEPGATWIGVRTHDPDEHERARRALARQQPIEVRQL